MTDDLDARLREVFARHADDAGDTVTMAGVATTQRRVRRRRGAAVVATVAVVATLGVSVPALVSRGGPDAAPADPLTPSLPATLEHKPAVGPVSTGYLASLPLDGAPGAYLAGDELVRADGSRSSLPATTSLEPWDGGAAVGDDVVLARRIGPLGLIPSMFRVGSDGTVVDEWDGWGPATSADGSRVAWWRSAGADRTGDVAVATDGNAGTVVQSDVEAAVPLGFRADGSVVLDFVGASLPFGGIEVHDVDDVNDRVSGRRTGAPADEGGAVIEADGSLVFTSDRWQTWEFSPDGRWVVGVSSVTGGDAGSIAVLDSTTGEAVSELTLLSPDRPLSLWQHRVDDAGNLDVVVGESVGRDVAFTIVRLRPDGTVVRLTPVVRWAPRRIGAAPIVMLD